MTTHPSEFFFVNTVEMFHSDDGDFLQENSEFPGITNFKNFLFFLGKNVTFYDRTCTIQSPFNIVPYPGLDLPKYEKISLSYGECCENRARELLSHAENTGRQLCVFYSGGIDSTCVVTSLLKVATKEQKRLINIMMSFDSYVENKHFYESYISNNLNIIPSHSFINILGDDRYICVTAEGNDQLFGAQFMMLLVLKYGRDIVLNTELTHDKLLMFLKNGQNTERHTEEYVNLLQQVVSKAPVKIDTMSKFLWWCNFTLKWHCVYMRILSFVSKHQRLNIHPEDNYFVFYNTSEFQLWSMGNSDNLVNDTIKSYKHVCKDYIFDFDGNEDYRINKLKIGSLPKICRRKSMAAAIDSNMKYYDKLPDANFLLNPNNSFIF